MFGIILALLGLMVVAVGAVVTKKVAAKKVAAKHREEARTQTHRSNLRTLALQAQEIKAYRAMITKSIREVLGEATKVVFGPINKVTVHRGGNNYRFSDRCWVALVATDGVITVISKDENPSWGYLKEQLEVSGGGFLAHQSYQDWADGGLLGHPKGWEQKVWVDARTFDLENFKAAVMV